MDHPLPERAEPPRVLVAGATGFVGRALLGRLAAEGVSVRALARRTAPLRPLAGPQLELFAGDLLERDDLRRALRGIETAYYLVHCMDASQGFEARETLAATQFAAEARRAGVRRIVYLGGLSQEIESTSPHFRSRLRTGEILRDSGVPTIEFRASIVIGSGSLSFELIRSLVDRLPVMITPRWLDVPAQPIAVDDLVEFLLQARTIAATGSRVVEVGGPDVVDYADLLREYGRQAGRRPTILRVPVLTPWLSGLWLGLVTPVSARIGRRLVESVRHASVVRDHDSTAGFDVRPRGVVDAIARALAAESSQGEVAEPTPAAPSAPPRAAVLEDLRVAHVRAAPANVFSCIERIGGATGWYAYDGLWRFRGWLDRCLGGVGMGRARRDPEHLRVGDAVDCWKVTDRRAGERVILEAEMRLPGRAWLSFSVVEQGSDSLLVQRARFEPSGWLGRLYWFGIWPLHALVFRGMIRGLRRAAEEEESARVRATSTWTPTQA